MQKIIKWSAMACALAVHTQAALSDKLEAPVRPGQSPGVTEMADDLKQIMRSVDEVKRLPIAGMSLVKAGDRLFLTSDNGHFLVAGNFKLVDMWQGKVIKSMDDTVGINKVDLRKIGFNPDELSAFSFGKGKPEVTLFVDPLCDHCHDLIRQLPALEGSYTFKVVLIPVLGSKSAEVAKQLLCNKDREQAWQALLAKDYSKLPPLVRKEGSCDLKPLQKAVVTTKLLGVDGVPYLFLPSKNTHKGGAKSFATLLEKDREDEINGR